MQDAVEFERKFQAAVAALESAGVSRHAANPIFTRMVRALGLRVKPPFYMSFQQLVCFMGLPFGIFWGLFMATLASSVEGLSVGINLGSIIFVSVFFGLLMAYFIRNQRARIDVPDWDAL